MKKYLPTLTILLFLFCLSTMINAQRTIKGQVMLEDDGEAIGANVVVDGNEKIGTVTEYDGTFTLAVPEEAKALKISYTGFNTQVVSIENKNSVFVTLLPDSEILSEMVVTGYGHSNRRIGKRKRNKIAIRGVGTIGTISNSGYPTIDPEGTEEYAELTPNKYVSPLKESISTFSIDVDNASYSNIRRYIQQMEMAPPKDAVRLEEMINYFNYDYEIPQGTHPFSIATELGNAPWNPKHRLLKIGLKGYEMQYEQAPVNNLVFLIDVSGSMSSYNKLDLVKKSLKMLVDNMRDEDQVSIVVYAGAAGLVLPNTKGIDKKKIIKSLSKLEAGGSTAGGAGIRLAYQQAKEHFIEKGNNRVILCTDGDFNVGVNSEEGLEKLIEKKRDDGIFLTVLGYGMGNYKDNKLEILADKGNGNYGYIDNIREAKKMLVDEVAGTMFTIAKDVKIQIQFNPEQVESYRLIGYENRLLENKDFEDDKKDAGELGAGHTVTALYEIIPKGSRDKENPKVKKKEITTPEKSLLVADDLATIRLRYKKPEGDKSQLIEQSIPKQTLTLAEFSEDFKFICSVAAWGMLLRDSEYKGKVDWKMIQKLAEAGKGDDKHGYRREFINMVKSSKNIINGGRLNAGK